MLRVTAPRQARGPFTFIGDDMAPATHVFLRHDAVRRKPLQPPYDGPDKVLRRTSKTMTLDICGRQEIVTLDRVKPAHLDIAPPDTSPKVVDLDQPGTSSTATSTSQDHPPFKSSIDRSHSVSLKPVQPHTTTRSGRHVYWPVRFDSQDLTTKATTRRCTSPTNFPHAVMGRR